MQKYLNVIGWLYMSAGAVALIAMFLVGLGVGRGSIGGTEFIILTSPFLLFGPVGRGILDRKSWARIAGILFATLIFLIGVPQAMFCGYGLLNIPCLRGVLIGGVFGAFGLWVLLNKETKALFSAGQLKNESV